MFDPQAEDAADPQTSATGSGPPALRPLRVGARVRSSNPAPTFASDPQLGDRGVVIQASGDEGAGPATYLVRWDGGVESWSKREHLEPAGRSALAPSTATTPDGPRPTGPARPPMGPGVRRFQRFLPLIFILFAGQGLVRAFVNSAHHPSSGTLVIALVIVAIVVLAVLRVVRRGGPPRPRQPPGA
jgi:hypothetical protein